ncbi:hypothetical protein O181_117805 [Austropuccinia psidii MF-1]|uniref:Uncharacterized protein n=1 Tax=Austropuccinia psidii MF-1 TaxID=1389203 RepID=A0A9Q3PYR2_9BASI|nr:hypothetical protein [Austropuccinia psidii MF-1]
MVTISGQNSIIPNQGAEIQRPFRRRTLQLISLAIHGGYQKTIQGPHPPGPAGVGLAVQFRIIQRAISQAYYIISISFQGRKYFSIPWTIQLVHTGNTQVSHMALAQLGQFSPTLQFSRWPELYWPNSDNTAGDSPSRIRLSAFHIYWPPFSTWGLCPQLINILYLFLSIFFVSFMKVNTDIIKSVIVTFLLCLSVDIGGHIVRMKL